MDLSRATVNEWRRDKRRQGYLGSGGLGVSTGVAQNVGCTELSREAGLLSTAEGGSLLQVRRKAGLMYTKGSGRQVYFISAGAVPVGELSSDPQHPGGEWRMFSVHPITIMYGADEMASSFPSGSGVLGMPMPMSATHRPPAPHTLQLPLKGYS